MSNNHKDTIPLGDIKYLENTLSDIETRNYKVEQLKERFKDVKI